MEDEVLPAISSDSRRKFDYRPSLTPSSRRRSIVANKKRSTLPVSHQSGEKLSDASSLEDIFSNEELEIKQGHHFEPHPNTKTMDNADRIENLEKQFEDWKIVLNNLWSQSRQTEEIMTTQNKVVIEEIHNLKIKNSQIEDIVTNKKFLMEQFNKLETKSTQYEKTIAEGFHEIKQMLMSSTQNNPRTSDSLVFNNSQNSNHFSDEQAAIFGLKNLNYPSGSKFN